MVHSADTKNRESSSLDNIKSEVSSVLLPPRFQDFFIVGQACETAIDLPKTYHFQHCSQLLKLQNTNDLPSFSPLSSEILSDDDHKISDHERAKLSHTNSSQTSELSQRFSFGDFLKKSPNLFAGLKKGSPQKDKDHSNGRSTDKLSETFDLPIFNVWKSKEWIPECIEVFGQGDQHEQKRHLLSEHATSSFLEDRFSPNCVDGKCQCLFHANCVYFVRQ
ncbi:hypothetical protein RFI_08899 [Reticulomyxa filosa]|uniref:Uncharacterized protein n=1 Tax=Reticulomyxa filosa TaxID=46433 RepID=X6NQN7_RETFI|nr:hypothetical protein RFI_08899 [Reticulomyxa filosa]|eukprot:ETO28233.1 hypothetical protein RFI_08899 [Reticulomyxa filosa]